LKLGFAFEVLRSKFLDERVVEAFHLVGRADGDDAAFVDDGDTVGTPNARVAVMRTPTSEVTCVPFLEIAKFPRQSMTADIGIEFACRSS